MQYSAAYATTSLDFETPAPTAIASVPSNCINPPLQHLQQSNHTAQPPIRPKSPAKRLRSTPPFFFNNCINLPSSSFLTIILRTLQQHNSHITLRQLSASDHKLRSPILTSKSFATMFHSFNPAIKVIFQRIKNTINRKRSPLSNPSIPSTVDLSQTSTVQTEHTCTTKATRLTNEAQLQQQSAAEQTQQQQQTETARIILTKTFVCRRYKAEFTSNTKLHCHIRQRHAKKSTSTAPSQPSSASTSIPISPPIPPSKSTAAISPPKPSTATSPPKHSVASTGTLASPPTPPPSPTQCLTNHVTKPPPCLPPPPVRAYLTVQNLYNMFEPFSKPLRQRKITSYFKPADHSTVKLASIRKRADSSSQCQMAWIHDLGSASQPSRRRWPLHQTSATQLHSRLLPVEQVSLVTVAGQCRRRLQQQHRRRRSQHQPTPWPFPA